MAETLKLTPSETLTIREDTPAALEVEGRWGPGGSPPPKHFHPSQDEHFEVLEGELHARVDGIEHVLGVGDTLDIPRGAVHQMWNPGEVEGRAIWRTTPAMRTASWFRAIDGLHRSGRVGSNGMPGPLASGVMLSEYRDVFRLAGPDLLLRPAFAVLGAIGRARGYRATG
jgi:mannose-6-phosphate isomerase-like protein (cupin superfamily)